MNTKSMMKWALAALVMSGQLQAAPQKPAGDWILWYDRPAEKWVEAMPVGNGRLGAMVFGGVAGERIQFNESTIWTGRPHDYARKGAVKVLPELRKLLNEGKQREAEALAMKDFMSDPIRQKAYQPCGDLLISQPDAGEPQDYRRWLDLDSGTAVTEWTSGGAGHRRETFASYPANLIVTRLSADQPGKTTASISLGSPHRKCRFVIDPDGTIVLHGEVEADGVVFEARAQLIHQGGALTRDEGGKTTIRGADWIEIRLTAATNVESWKSLGADPTRRTIGILKRSSTRTYEELRNAHLADHRALFRRVSLDLGRTAAAEATTDRRIEGFQSGADPQLAALVFQYGRYLLIACSRPGGQPANLQGIWNDSLNPPWDSKYTCNINTQMNYWPAGVTNLAECGQPLFDALHELRESGTITAREHYGARGWTLHHNFDLWRGTAPINHSDHGIWISGAPWLSLHLWEHYLFTGDREFLRKSWPVLRDSAVFFTDYLTEDPATKTLVCGPSNSPEQGGAGHGAFDGPSDRPLFVPCHQRGRAHPWHRRGSRQTTRHARAPHRS